jgi:hypothetical protein
MEHPGARQGLGTQRETPAGRQGAGALAPGLLGDQFPAQPKGENGCGQTADPESWIRHDAWRH